MIEHAQKEKKQLALLQRHDLESRLERVREKERKAKERNEEREPLRKRAVCTLSSNRTARS